MLDDHCASWLGRDVDSEDDCVDVGTRRSKLRFILTTSMGTTVWTPVAQIDKWGSEVFMAILGDILVLLASLKMVSSLILTTSMWTTLPTLCHVDPTTKREEL